MELSLGITNSYVFRNREGVLRYGVLYVKPPKTAVTARGRERGREGGREGWMEGGREGGREGRRDGGREGGRDGGWE